MTITPGEYEFTCSECRGEGSVQVLVGMIDEATDTPDLRWEKCEDCWGDGTVTVDETDAAERILELGHTPLRTPPTS